MTSALHFQFSQVHGLFLFGISIHARGKTIPTQDLLGSVYNTATYRQPCFLFFDLVIHTPASTLVISKTRIPANGKVGESAAAAVANPREPK